MDGAFGLIRDCETDGSFAALLTSTEQASGSVVMGTIISVEGWKLNGMLNSSFLFFHT